MTRDDDGLAVVPPLGSVVWSQTVAPFDTPCSGSGVGGWPTRPG